MYNNYKTTTPGKVCLQFTRKISEDDLIHPEWAFLYKMYRSSPDQIARAILSILNAILHQKREYFCLTRDVALRMFKADQNPGKGSLNYHSWAKLLQQCFSDGYFTQVIPGSGRAPAMYQVTDPDLLNCLHINSNAQRLEVIDFIKKNKEKETSTPQITPQSTPQITPQSTPRNVGTEEFRKEGTKELSNEVNKIPTYLPNSATQTLVEDLEPLFQSLLKKLKGDKLNQIKKEYAYYKNGSRPTEKKLRLFKTWNSLPEDYVPLKTKLKDAKLPTIEYSNAILSVSEVEPSEAVYPTLINDKVGLATIHGFIPLSKVRGTSELLLSVRDKELIPWDDNFTVPKKLTKAEVLEYINKK